MTSRRKILRFFQIIANNIEAQLRYNYSYDVTIFYLQIKSWTKPLLYLRCYYSHGVTINDVARKKLQGEGGNALSRFYAVGENFIT